MRIRDACGGGVRQGDRVKVTLEPLNGRRPGYTSLPQSITGIVLDRGRSGQGLRLYPPGPDYDPHRHRLTRYGFSHKAWAKVFRSGGEMVCTIQGAPALQGRVCGIEILARGDA